MKLKLIIFLSFIIIISPKIAYTESDTLMLGIKTTMPLSVNLSTTKDLSYMCAFSNDKANGIGAGAGFFLEVIPIKYLAIETGVFFRYFSLGNNDISYYEMQIPIIPKLRIPVTSNVNVLFGIGGSYFVQFHGTILSPSGQEINIPKSDLTMSFSFITKLEIQFRLNRSGNILMNVEFGYEFAKRSLKMTAHDIFFGLSLGFIVI